MVSIARRFARSSGKTISPALRDLILWAIAGGIGRASGDTAEVLFPIGGIAGPYILGSRGRKKANYVTYTAGVLLAHGEKVAPVIVEYAPKLINLAEEAGPLFDYFINFF